MSIGLTLRVAYKETCEICDKIAHLTSVIFQLAQMGYYEEAKHLMLEVAKKKK